MTHPLSLAFLTISDATPPQAVEAAAQAGYDAVGLRLLPAAPNEGEHALLTDNALLAETLDRLADTGVVVGDVEIVRLKPATRIEDFTRFCERARQLGASNVLVAGDDPDAARLTESFARFCELAAGFDLTADLEFMPWTGVPDLAAASAVVEGAGASNGGILVDALHYDRSGSTLDEVRALPPGRIHYAQLCDGPAQYDRSDEGLIRVARGERLFPGDGGIDLVGLVRALPEGTPLSIETPMTELARHTTPNDRALRAIEAAKTVLRAAGRL